jgi:hypothetical protein
MSIFFIVGIASAARLALAGSASVCISIMPRGTICHDRPKRSLTELQGITTPPSAPSAAQGRSTSARSTPSTLGDGVSLECNRGPPFSAWKACPNSSNSVGTTLPRCRAIASP